MMKRRSLLGLLLALGAVFCLTVAPAAAQDPVTVTLAADATTETVTLPQAGQAMILDLNGHTLTGSGGQLINNGELTIRDTSAGQTGRVVGRVVNNQDATLTLESGTITGGRGGYGAGVCTVGAFIMTGGSITGNEAPNPGGGVYVSGEKASFTMSGGVISDNRCVGTTQQTSRGGGVYVARGIFTMTGGSITGNSAGSGAGVGLANAVFTMTGGSITGNKAGIRDADGNLTGALGIGGGGIAAWSDTTAVEITGGEISDNLAYNTGGAIKLYRGTVTLKNVTVTGNKTTAAELSYGGAFAVGGVGTDAAEIAAPHTLTIGEGCVISGNGSDVPASRRTASTFLLGAVGFAGRGGEIVMDGGTVTGNSPEGANGVFYLYPSAPGTMTMNGGVISGNTTRSGALWISENALFTMNGGTITANTATNTTGGGVFLYAAGSQFHMTDGEISGNQTLTQPGAGVGVRGGRFVMDGGIITGNVAGTADSKQNGAGVSVNGTGEFIMNGGAVKENRAAMNGGGVQVRDNASFTLNGGEISGNAADSGTGAEVLVIGGDTAARFTMNGGGIGLAEDRDKTKLNFFSTATTYTQAELLGGTVYCSAAAHGAGARIQVHAAGTEFRGYLGTKGGSSDNKVDIWSGSLLRLLSTHDNVTVHGGLFRDPTYLTEAGAPGGEIAYSGREDYAYQYAPALAYDMAADGSKLTVSMDGAASAWTYCTGVETTAVCVPVTADFTIGERAVTGVTVTEAGGRYTAETAVTAADVGAHVRVVLRDARGEPIRALAGRPTWTAGQGGTGGDLTGDGKTNAKDVVLLQRFVAGGYGVTLEAADLTGDGKTNAKDVVLLQRFVAGGYGVTLPDGGPAVTDDPHEDDELNLLFVGNSFCYYWTDELYGMLTAAGYENVTVSNVYYSGCTLPQHWSWILSGQASYHFITVDKDGRRDVPDKDLNSCLAAKNWDTVELLQGNSPMYSGGEAGARANVDAYLPLLTAYFEEWIPKADRYWLANWTRELANPNDTMETVEQQQAVADAFMAIGRDVQAQYGYTCAPCAAAWQLVRYDPLIAVDGKTLTTRIYQGRPDFDDYAHDGDVGGGQYLNACIWFETLTRTSCVGNTFRPSYIFNGTDYSLTEAQITLLQNAAHQAVADFQGADWVR